MTIAPPKPSSFKRSTENTTEADLQARTEEGRLRREEAPGLAAMAAFEATPGRDPGRSSESVDGERHEDLYDAMAAEDLSTYDIDGLVR